MATSSFGYLGALYVLIVPTTLYGISYFVRKEKHSNTEYVAPTISLWSSPIPYLSIVFVVIVAFNIFLG
jgi:hypothetical protein